MDEVFGDENFVALIGINKTSGLQSGTSLPHVLDFVLQYARSVEHVKFRPLFIDKEPRINNLNKLAVAWGYGIVPFSVKSGRC